jgi:thiopeptide-type bacteriocin biosynthesis protein
MNDAMHRPVSFFVVRTPLLPFETILDWSAAGPDEDALLVHLLAVARRPEVADAIALASESLAAEMKDAHPPRRVLLALARYVTRAAARPTPFGLFAGYTAGRIGDMTSLELPPASAYERRTELGIGSIARFLATMDDDSRANAPLTVASTLYETGSQVRYIEERGKEHALRAARGGRELRLALDLARQGLTATQLAERLASDLSVPVAAATRYVEQLIASQLVLPDVQPRLTAANPLTDVADRLRVADGARAALLDEVARELHTIDTRGLGANDYTRLREHIEAMAPNSPLPAALHVLLHKPSPSMTLDEATAGAIYDAIDALRRMFGDEERDSLRIFRDRFLERYELRFVPLTEALDEELGVGFAGYGDEASDDLPLLRDVHFPVKPTLPRWRNAHRVLIEKLGRVLAAGETEIELTGDDVERMAADDPPPFPDSLASFVTLCGDGRLFVRSAFGPSGAQFVGRFCNGDEALTRQVREWLREEERLRPDAVFAEVVMLPDGRDANVVVRPALREYEIPFLGHASVAPERRIDVSDLLLGVRNGRFVLWSRSLDREVIPRVTTAHNFKTRGVSVYRLVGAMQKERDAGSVYWEWGPLAELPFLPRVRYGNVIFARAAWLVTPDELKPLRAGAGAQRLAAARELAGRRRMPRFMLFVQGDNELVIDWTNIVTIDAFTAVAHERGGRLDEMLPAPDALAVHGPEGHFTHELVLPFVRREARSTKPVRRPAIVPLAQRTFPPGSEWMYLKIYCGYATEDRLIADTILPAMRGLRDQGKIDRWFFIRYVDPAFHLRLRVHGAPEVLWTTVLADLTSRFAPMMEIGTVAKVQIDTYSRETERYGGADAIGVAEAIFEADSDAVAAVMPFLLADSELRWQLAAYGSDRLLADCGFDLHARLELMQALTDDFGRELGNDRGMRDDLARKNRAVRPALETLFATAESQPWFAAFEERSRRTRPLAVRVRSLDLTVRYEDVVASYLHMHLNRVFRFIPRKQERVLYDVLHRRYLAERARTRTVTR